jgi:hypothetical protein
LAGSVRERAHNENTDPRVLRTSTWCSHVSHSPALGRDPGRCAGAGEDIA